MTNIILTEVRKNDAINSVAKAKKKLIKARIKLDKSMARLEQLKKDTKC